MAKELPFKFVYRKTKRCPYCGQEKPMLRVQKMCDDCRRERGLDRPRVPKGVGYDR